PYEHLGETADVLAQVADGTHAFAKTLKDAERAMVVLGMGALTRADGAAILAAGYKLAEATGMVSGDWNGFNVLHTAAARVGALDVGFVPGEHGKDTRAILDAAASGAIEVVYLLGADEIDTTKLKNAFVIYQGHHGDAGAHVADVILPGAAYTEKNGTYVNTEGRPQLGQRAIFPPGDAREDWSIIRALSDSLGKTLPYDSLDQVRAALAECNSIFTHIDEVIVEDWSAFGTAGAIEATPLVSPVTNYYQTDPISRASRTMAQCTQEFVIGKSGKVTGTYG
ncbi:MAG: molybdopterin-dependent oxidoreductase, partial [Rhodospirillaceae bacterium]